jgi:DMSO/TMAO reductase YedYZ molybdopterin-dependent catalytic subunit
MSSLISRRKLVTAGIATAAGAAGLGGAVKLMGSYGLIPPDYQGILGVGKTLTYASQRLLTSGQSLAREFPSSRISKVHPVNGLPPEDDTYKSWLANGFRDWRLTVDGLVARPSSLSLDDLKRLPGESHTILHACEEGWSYIAEWTGVRLSRVLEMVGTKPEARYVVFTGIPNPKQDTHVVRLFWDSIDMHDALHPQTLLAYGMNGEALPPGHGAPLRLRLGRNLGYKNVKYLVRMTVTDDITTAFDLKRLGPWSGGI